MQFLREMELYDRLLNVSGTDIGTLQGGHLSARQFSELMFLKNNTLAASKAGIDLHEWRKGVYGIDTLEPSSALFGQQIAREMVTDDYRMQNAFGQKIPEVLASGFPYARLTNEGWPVRMTFATNWRGIIPRISCLPAGITTAVVFRSPLSTGLT